MARFATEEFAKLPLIHLLKLFWNQKSLPLSNRGALQIAIVVVARSATEEYAESHLIHLFLQCKMKKLLLNNRDALQTDNVAAVKSATETFASSQLIHLLSYKNHQLSFNDLYKKSSSFKV